MVLSTLPAFDIDKDRSLYKTNVYMVKIPNSDFPFGSASNDKVWLYIRNASEANTFKSFLRQFRDNMLGQDFDERMFWIPKLTSGRSCDIGSIFVKTQEEPKQYTYMMSINKVIVNPDDKPKLLVQNLHIAREVKFHIYYNRTKSSESITLTLRNVRCNSYRRSDYNDLQLEAYETWPGAKNVTRLIIETVGGSRLRSTRLYIVYHVYYADVIFERDLSYDGMSRTPKSATYLGIPIAFSLLKYKFGNKLSEAITPDHKFKNEDQQEFIFNKDMPKDDLPYFTGSDEKKADNAVALKKAEDNMKAAGEKEERLYKAEGDARRKAEGEAVNAANKLKAEEEEKERQHEAEVEAVIAANKLKAEEEEKERQKEAEADARKKAEGEAVIAANKLKAEKGIEHGNVKKRTGFFENLAQGKLNTKVVKSKVDSDEEQSGCCRCTIL